MNGNLGDAMLVLKFLVILLAPLLLLPTPVGGAAQVIALAALVLIVAVAAMTAGGGETETTNGPPVGRRDAAPSPRCGLSDPDAPGRVRARAPGTAVRSA